MRTAGRTRLETQARRGVGVRIRAWTLRRGGSGLGWAMGCQGVGGRNEESAGPGVNDLRKARVIRPEDAEGWAMVVDVV